MPYKRHDAFRTPRDETEIWHYTTLGRLAGMLALKSLYFVRANRFPDPWEASMPAAHFEPENIRRLHGRRMAPIKGQRVLSVEDEMRYGLTREKWSDRERKDFVVSCWCRSKGESDMHWQTYGRDTEGVAIRSSVQQLKRALPSVGPNVYVGQVRYIDFEKSRIPREYPIQRTMYKRLAFENDREIRAVIDAHTTKGRFGPTGGFVKVDMNELVKEIVLSPMASRSLTEGVRAMVGLLGLGRRVRRSQLLDPPKYRSNRFKIGTPKRQVSLPFPERQEG